MTNATDVLPPTLELLNGTRDVLAGGEDTFRLLQPIWDFLRFNYGHILRSPLFPPFFALSIDYIWVAVFTCKPLDCCS